MCAALGDGSLGQARELAEMCSRHIRPVLTTQGDEACQKLRIRRRFSSGLQVVIGQIIGPIRVARRQTMPRQPVALVPERCALTGGGLQREARRTPQRQRVLIAVGTAQIAQLHQHQRRVFLLGGGQVGAEVERIGRIPP